MTDYLNEFTPDWPHGHVIVFSDGTVKPFVVKVTDGPGHFPIWGHVAGDFSPHCFSADGSRCGEFHLRNAAPPKRVPREHWMNVYPPDDDGLAYNDGPFRSRKEADDAADDTRIECIHFREVIEETEAGEEKLPDGFKLAFAKSALHKPREVDDAFYWASTPQGCDFWAGYSVKRLSPEDMARAREALRRWIEIAERGVSK